MTVIALFGYARTGKDTAGSAIEDEFGFAKRAFADPVREGLLRLDPYVGEGLRLSAALNIFDGWEGIKSTVYSIEVRRLTQELGTAVGRGIVGESVWVDNAYSRMIQDDNTVFTDVRFPNEFEMLRKHGAHFIKIDKPGVAEFNGHVSEKYIETFLADKVIVNDGTRSDFESEVIEHVRSLLQK